MIDKFTGWIECKPTPTQSANFTCVSLFEWISQYGLMNQLICDNGSHFNTEEVKAMMISSYGIPIRFGVPYYPQGQGKVERANGVLKELMKKYAYTYGSCWDTWLAAALYVMRTMSRGDHGCSAFFLAYGRHPRSIAGDIDHEVFSLEDEHRDLEELLFIRMEEIIELNEGIIPTAQKNIKVYKEKMINQFNKKAKVLKFKVADLVMVLDRGASDMATSLLPKWLGPFRISAILGQDIYEVKDGELKFPFAFHASQLRLYKARPRLAANLRFYSQKVGVRE